MTTLQIPIFATKGDWREVLMGIEEQRPLQYVLMGVFKSRAVQVMASPFASENESKAPPPSPAGYLVLDRGTGVSVRCVPQRRGGELYAVDQIENEVSIVLRPGSELKECLVAGQIGTASSHAASLELFRLFESELKRKFGRIKSYRVGREATALLQRGVRLTANPRSPAEMDLSA